MTKVYISPPVHISPYGIRRVVEALMRYLPDHGITPVNSEEEADVVHVHATAFVHTTKPVLYTSHGLYWADHEWPHGLLQANQAMMDYTMRADAVTAVSNWVSHAISRSALVRPNVIYHGVDTNIWTPSPERGGYVLWNKARADIVSNPDDVMKLAEVAPDLPIVTTIGEPRHNVQVVGVVNHDTMRDMVRKAAVYLATARETFGIGTLEALACGVPVVGWDHGGQREIIENGRNGVLVPYGDYDALARAVREAMAAGAELQNAARLDAVEKWGWEKRVKQYADLIKQLAAERNESRPDVSVIVTSHNLGAYLHDCLDSVMAQEGVNLECLVVDDDSTDDTEQITNEYAERDGRFTYVKTPYNLKLSGARNYGAKMANGRNLIFLDADDMLAPGAVALLNNALHGDPFIHIAYGHLDTVRDDGGDRKRNDWPFEAFSWFGQMSHLNQLPYCSMMRRRVWESVGGYRDRDWRAEDASFWCRATSFGFKAAKVTDKSTLIYRIRGNSKSAQERSAGHSDGDWTAFFPWRIAGTVDDGRQAVRAGTMPHRDLVPGGAQGRSPDGCWPIWSHHDPLVSIIIPVGPGHAHYLIDALDSVQAQTFPFWEAIVVDNTLTGAVTAVLPPPWAKVIVESKPGIAYARNAGLFSSRAPLVLFLDADDMLTPNALHDLVGKYIESEGLYTYGDFITVDEKQVKHKNSKDYDRMSWEKEGLHPITCLIPKEWAEGVGGFDPHLPGWEDWDFFLKMVVNGFCGKRAAVPTLVYRLHSGMRREQSLNDGSETLAILRQRYADYFEGRKPMAPCCGGNGTSILEAKRRFERPKPEAAAAVIAQRSDGLVRVKYSGTEPGQKTFKRIGGVKLSRPYTFGNTTLHRYADATPEDAKLLIEAGIVTAVSAPAVDVAQMETRTAPPPPVDAAQAAERPAPPPAETAVPQPKPEPAPEPVSLDITAMSIPDMQNAVIGFGLSQLRAVLEAEMGGKNRVRAIKFLKSAIKDAERVG